MVNKKHLSLFVTSDVHGYVYPTNYSDREERHLGLAKVATLVEEKRKTTNVILLDNGDLIQGSPLTFHHAKYKRDTPNPLIKVANHMGYVASVFGNHEFNYGLDYLQQVVEQSNFPWLSSTVLYENDRTPAFGKPYLIKEIDEIKVAILGVTTHYIPNWEDPKNIKGLAFEDALKATKRWVQHIRKEEKPDVLIVSYHGGFERDLESGEPTEALTGENQGYQMCMEIEGIDILVTGHQHRSIATQLNGVTVVQPSNNGQLLGEVDVEFELIGDQWTYTTSTASLHQVDDKVKANEGVLHIIKDYEQATQAWLDQPIGDVDGDMTINDPFHVRIKEHPFIEFINKVQMDIANVSISNTSLFNNASPGFGSTITMRDIVSNYVYPNTLKVIRVSGKDIREALEQSATYFMLDDQGKITVNPSFIDPKPQHYNYDMWEGIDYELTISNPVGTRVTKLNYDGNQIDESAEFDVVMNNYRAGGGGNFYMYQGKEVVQDIPTDMTELIANYILERKKINATCNENWQVVK
ncbi:bifunctional metallophosphatase/5'-nucleotidase [Aquibacillus koreensis]|uniref:Bifunctional metallophosphatase/5'-nucleotidase n=1 Tax=Aquibacillus koreensis TaxID=279446 RepID=A0A9X4AJZ9_9BACI|nr:bifunctional UDP-sugar hydrolase/5'-nucleotidase [Aquibacillus koreensis]MCT2538178.1 bifunctional metallophosphatase/5'-nucleotidase [Aquibacillus koreensis]MDC3420878.1 bifunctional metallophosphatase/5'-nucleotidase [Aquibacillus koreensis]